MREFSSASELLEAVRAQGALVYGTGFVARSLMEALAGCGMAACVSGAVVSEPLAHAETFYGLPVCGVREVSAGDPRIILVAVHASVLPEIELALAKRGLDDAVWVYPHLPELLYGKPIRRAVPMRVADILAAQNPGHYWISVRALAAMEFAGESEVGCNVYLKTQAMHCSPDTAVRRLARFRELDASFGARGFDSRYPLLCDESLCVVDGLHRLALSWLAGIDEVVCDVVRSSSSFERLIDERNRITPAILDQAGLTACERMELEGVHDRLWEDIRTGS